MSRGKTPRARRDRRQTTILVVDDEEIVSESLKLTLESNGYAVWCASSGAEALEICASRGLPDLALLDVVMPRMNGLELGARIQRSTDLPIIFVSARRDSQTITKAIEEIAEDYVTKPFDVPVLLARIKRVLKRNGRLDDATTTRIRIDDRLEIEPFLQTVIVRGRPVHLSRGENKLLLVLLRNTGRTLPADYLQARLWPRQEFFDEGALRTMIYRLRKKIEPEPARPTYVITDRGVGYRFVKPGG